MSRQRTPGLKADQWQVRSFLVRLVAAAFDLRYKGPASRPDRLFAHDFEHPDREQREALAFGWWKATGEKRGKY